MAKGSTRGYLFGQFSGAFFACAWFIVIACGIEPPQRHGLFEAPYECVHTIFLSACPNAINVLVFGGGREGNNFSLTCMTYNSYNTAENLYISLGFFAVVLNWGGAFRARRLQVSLRPKKQICWADNNLSVPTEDLPR